MNKAIVKLIFIHIAIQLTVQYALRRDRLNRSFSKILFEEYSQYDAGNILHSFNGKCYWMIISRNCDFKMLSCGFVHFSCAAT